MDTITLTQAVSPSLSAVTTALIAALAVIVGAVIAGVVALVNYRKGLFIDTVTKERAKWRSELRVETAELVAQARCSVIFPICSGFCFIRFTIAKSGVLLRLNPKGRTDPLSRDTTHKWDRKIHIELSYISQIDNMSEEQRQCIATRKSINNHCDQLELAVQELIKQEWQKSKFEARKGRMFKDDTDPLIN